jgi:hypothetical protein
MAESSSPSQQQPTSQWKLPDGIEDDIEQGIYLFIYLQERERVFFPQQSQAWRSI